MASNQPPPLFGYPGQPQTYTLADGREASAGEVVARALVIFHTLNATMQWGGTEAAQAWNNLADESREEYSQQALEAWNQEIREGSVEVDLGNALNEAGAKALGAELIDAAVGELKDLQKPWHQLTEHEQQRIFNRVTDRVREAVAGTIRLLATNGQPHIVCELESITVKKGAKATIEIPKGDLHQEVLDAVGQPVILVIGGSLGQAQDIKAPKADPDQASLPLDPGAAVVHSDPED